MKSRKKIILFIIWTALYNVLIINLSNGHFVNAFLYGAFPGDDYVGTLLWYFWFSGISFYFMGSVEEYFSGFGIYEMTRNKQRKQVIVQQYIKITVSLILLVSIQILVIYASDKLLHGIGINMESASFVFSLMMLYLTVYSLIQSQMFLELYFNAQVAMLITNIYVVFAITLAGLLFKFQKLNLLLYILIPNFSMAQRTSIMNANSFVILKESALAIILLFCVVVGMLSVERMKTKDFI